MNSVKEIALCFCATAVFCAGISILNGKVLEKSGRYIMALIILCSIIGSVSAAKWEPGFLPQNVIESGENKTANAIGEHSAEYIVGNLLKENEITFEKITATVSKNAENGIVISEIEINGVSNPEKAREILRKTGIDCSVVFK